jgi:hypothetical protein
MDAEARNQYLRELREEYCLARKAVKSQLLDEAVKRTGLARKVIIRKLARPVTLVRRPRAKRRRIYDAAVAAALIELWTLFDYPCGQRLVPLLREQVPRLRQQGWWHCPEEVAAKLLRISAKTADRLLAPQRRRLRLDRRRGSSMRRLLLEQIPLKVAEEWDRRQVGNLQVDFVAHCGQSTAGSFLWTVSTVDVTTNGWDGEPVVHLAAKTRRGSKVHCRYDVPATPYQRLLASGQLSQAARQSLQQRYASLNPIQLRQQIEQRQNELLRTIRRSETRPDSARKLTPRSVTSFVTQRVAVQLPEEMT